MLRRSLWILCCLLLQQTVIPAQIPGMRKYTQLDGFTASTGYNIDQDELGCLWIGTDNGSMSFDGKRFYTTVNDRRFPDVEILDCRPIGNHMVVLLPVTREACYLYNGRLVTAAEDPRLKIVHNSLQNVMMSDPVTGDYWLFNRDKTRILYRFHGNTITPVQVDPKLMATVGMINNQLIGQVHKGKDLVTVSYNLVTHVLKTCTDEGGRPAAINEIFMTPSRYGNNYLITHRQNQPDTISIYSYSVSSDRWTRLKKIALPVTDKVLAWADVDRNHNLWIKYVGDAGFRYYGSVFAPGQNCLAVIDQVNTANSIFTDKNNNIWLSAQDNALYFISARHFKNLLLTYRFSFRQKKPKAISGDGNGKLCISYANDRTLNCVSGTQNKNLMLDRYFNEGSRGILPVGHSRFILYNTAVALYDMCTHSMQHIHTSIANCKDVCLYGPNDMLVAQDNGLMLISNFRDRRRTTQMLFSGRTTTVNMLPDGTILLGTPGGLYQKKSPADTALLLTDDILRNANITDIEPLQDGYTLIGTNAEGLLLCDPGWHASPAVNGKRKNIRGIFRQNDSTFWTPTTEGADCYRFDYHKTLRKIRTYTFYDGLPSNNCSSVYVDHDTAYIATSGGIGIILLKDTAQQMSPPGLYLRTITTSDTTLFYPLSPVTLHSNPKNLCFSISAISFESLGNIQYYYRLLPQQKEWVLSPGPDVQFPQLPPGDYTFEAYARNATGVASREKIQMYFTVKPAFWQSLYVKTAMILLALAITIWAIRTMIIRQQHKKLEAAHHKRRLAELELEAIKAQINPHFIHNCLNSIQYLNYKEAYTESQNYLDIFARLIRTTMQYSRQTFISVQEEAAYLSGYLQLEKLRFKDRLSYSISIGSEVAATTMIPALLVQPHVENALKHGIAGRKTQGVIEVAINRQEDRLIITITDNGPGFPDQHTSGRLGIRLSAGRVHTYNELFNLGITLSFSNLRSAQPETTGAVVTIIIPLQKNLWNTSSKQ